MKKPRLGGTPAKQLTIETDDDFVITPPPSPDTSVIQEQINSLKKNNQQQQKMRTNKQTRHEDRLLDSEYRIQP